MQRSALTPGRRTDAPSSSTVGCTSGTKKKLTSAVKQPSKACLTEVGPWGGKGGRSYQIQVEPACLNSIMVRSGETIQAIAFSYSDNEGKPHHAGPWGAEGGGLSGCIDTILLGPSEYLMEISGTVGMSTKFTSDVIMSLMFTTNISVYGPFGRGGGIPFRSRLTSNDNIVGFFVRATSLVDAIGIYVKPRREQTKNEALITKIGPWGCHAGRMFDVHVLPQRLVSVVVRSNEVIDSIGFTYSDCDGYQHSAGPWGAYGASPSRDGTIHTIVLGHSELLVEISGTIGPSTDWPDVVTSLLFVTNTGKYGPFGAGGGIPFCSTRLNNGNIVGFFVRSGWHVDSIGVYMNAQKEQGNGEVSSANPYPEGHIQELNSPCITKIGMWGGDKGNLQDINTMPFCLNNITICSGEVLHSLAFSYSDDRGKQHHGGPWGVSNGSFDMIHLGPSEFLIQVSGTIGSFSRYPGDVDTVTSITFTTDARSYGPFGRGGGIPFQSPAMSDGSIIGFFACIGKGAIDAIGIYVNPAERMEKKGLITKVGPWGNHLTRSYDLDVLPRRLISVVLFSSQVINSLAFTYIGCDGRHHSVGSWGGSDVQNGSFHTILLSRSEYLKEISGTVDLNPHSSDVITSLFLVTNTGSHGPFGEGAGTPFCIPAQENSSIVGFFAGAGKSINSLGAYLKVTNDENNGGATCSNSELQGDVKELDEELILKIGPWGGHKGNPKDVEESPLFLTSITVRSGEHMYSLAFSYSDRHGKHRHAGPWGNCEGLSYVNYDTIRLSPSEILTEVSGTIGFSTRYSENVVTSIIFITNARRYGPFGAGGGITFHSPSLSKGNIVGFFAHVGKGINAIGLYVNPERQPMREVGLITKVGPWGGDSGVSNDVAVLPQRLIRVVVHSGKVINSLSFTYSDCDGQVHTAGPFGGTGEPHNGSSHTILIGESEILMGISGTVGQSPDNSNVVTSLFFATNAVSYGPYGQGGGTRFQSPRQRDGAIVGFFVNAGDVIDAIGVYYLCPRGETTILEEEEGGSGISDDVVSRERAIKSASSILETIILDESAEPPNLPLALLQHITENFSDDREIGRGGFGIVYKGDLQNRSVAVKRLLNSHTIEEKTFNNEASSLIGVKHKNIVRFLGYCANTESKAIANPESGGALKYIFAEIRERLLCFEYINNGSLTEYLTDELSGLEWHTRYQIIRGICDGLVYLHKKYIVHMDMKPPNILLDDLMIPKITDFGISKILDGATHAVTTNPKGSLGYCAPEFINSGRVSTKSDIYSLGVIITELVTGCRGNPNIEHVLRRWRYRWNKYVNYPPLGYEQVKLCIEIALRCLSKSPRERPHIWDIVSMLNTIESMNEHINNAGESPVSSISPYPWELLEFDKLELNFPLEINKQTPCSLQLTNVTDGYVAFDIEAAGVLRYCIEPEKGVVAPRSKCCVMVTLHGQERVPHISVCKDEYLLMRCAVVNEGITAAHITEIMFTKKLGTVVDEVTFKVIIEPIAIP